MCKDNKNIRYMQMFNTLIYSKLHQSFLLRFIKLISYVM